MANHLCGAGESMSMAPSWYSRVPTIQDRTTAILPLARFSFSARTATTQPSHIESSQHRFVQPASIDEGCTNDGVRLRLSDDDQPAGAGAGSAGFRLQGRGAGQRLFQRDDDPGPVHGLHLQQGVGAGDLLLLGAGWSRADRPPLPLHGPGRHRHVLRHRHQPDQGTGAPRRLVSGVPAAPAPTPPDEPAAAAEEEADTAADAPSGAFVSDASHAPGNGVLFDAANGASSSTNSKNAASLLLLICALLYAF